MQAIYKFDLPFTEHIQLQMPEGAIIFNVATQYEAPRIWAICDTEAALVVRRLEMRATGQPFDGSEAMYLGTFQMLGGDLVYHLFEREYD